MHLCSFFCRACVFVISCDPAHPLVGCRKRCTFLCHLSCPSFVHQLNNIWGRRWYNLSSNMVFQGMLPVACICLHQPCGMHTFTIGPLLAAAPHFSSMTSTSPRLFIRTAQIRVEMDRTAGLFTPGAIATALRSTAVKNTP